MAKKEVKKENSKNKKSFIKDFKAELKRVIWPTPKQLVNNTVAVIVIVLITAFIVFVLDIAFESINKYGVNKVKEVIVTTNETSDNTTSEEVEESSDESSADEEEQPSEENNNAQ